MPPHPDRVRKHYGQTYEIMAFNDSVHEVSFMGTLILATTGALVRFETDQLGTAYLTVPPGVRLGSIRRLV